MRKKFSFYTALLFTGGLFFLSGCSNHYEARFPIEYVPFSKLPTTMVKIEEDFYPFTIDLGSSSYLVVNSEILEGLKEKEPFGSITTIDIKGDEYISKAYLLPEVKIRNMRMRNLEVREENLDFLRKGSLIYDDIERSPLELASEELGRIGRRIFVEKANLFLDFHNSVVFACCHLRHRKKEGYRLDRLVQVPIEVSLEDGIILPITTDMGIRKFMLDTGATRSLIKPSFVKDLSCEEWKPDVYRYHSSQFAMGGREFGPQPLILFEMAPFFENIDGILGMDFLKEHVVYLDFGKKVAYIGKASEVSSEVRQTSN